VTDERELLDGVTLRIGRRDYVVPPLNLRGVKRVQALAPALNSEGPESIDAGIEVIQMAVSRNYPDITREQLEEDIDLGNLEGLVKAVVQIAGFKDPKAEGAPAATPPP
jgi:hypothetical protein